MGPAYQNMRILYSAREKVSSSTESLENTGQSTCLCQECQLCFIDALTNGASFAVLLPSLVNRTENPAYRADPGQVEEEAHTFNGQVMIDNVQQIGVRFGCHGDFMASPCQLAGQSQNSLFYAPYRLFRCRQPWSD